jgi:hypothetical protein
MTASPRLSLPFLSAGQAQKEFFVNESLQVLDALVAGAVEEEPRNDPPESPALGSAYIVGAAPAGAWAGKPQAVAVYTAGGLRLISPIDGMCVLVKATGLTATYAAGSWEVGVVKASSVEIGGDQVVGARAAAISSPTGGAVVDAEARTALNLLLAALRNHGLIAM